MPTKQKLYDFCQTFVEGRISRIRNTIKDIQESLNSETKSSAGDKHETGRAMLQLEREKMGQQLEKAENIKMVLAKVDLENKSRTVGLGSWVKTSKADYFLSISAGEYKDNSTSIFCISTGTPIGRLLLGKSEGDTITFIEEEIKIIKVQ